MQNRGMVQAAALVTLFISIAGVAQIVRMVRQQRQAAEQGAGQDSATTLFELARGGLDGGSSDSFQRELFKHKQRMGRSRESSGGIGSVRETDTGFTLLMAAAVADNAGAVRVLMRMVEAEDNMVDGLGLDALEAHGLSVLHLLARQFNHRMLKLILTSNTLAALGVASIASGDALRRTPLMAAILAHEKAMSNQTDALETLNVLVKAHANLEARDSDGRDALMLASFVGNSQAALRLLSLPSINPCTYCVDCFGRTALFYASQSGLTDVVKILLAKRSQIPSSPPSQLRLRKAKNTAKKLASASAVSLSSFVSTSSSTASSALRLAMDASRIDPLNHVEDECGFTPVLAAIKGGFIDICEMLLEANADCSIIPRSRQNLIHLAVTSCNMNITQFIFDKSLVKPAALFEKDENGDTPFHIAANLRLSDILQYLAYKAPQSSDPMYNLTTITNDKGQTPLHMACQPLNPTLAFLKPEQAPETNQLATLNFLVTPLSSVLTVPDVYGMTPWSYYITNASKQTFEHLSIVKLLNPEGTQPIETPVLNADIIDKIACAKNMRALDLESRLRVFGDGNVSLEGAAHVLRGIIQSHGIDASDQKCATDGVIVIVGDPYGGKRLILADAQTNSAKFYQDCDTLYTRLATQKLETKGLLHEFLIQLETTRALAHTYTTTVDGQISSHGIHPVTEMYGTLQNITASRCLVCDTTAGFNGVIGATSAVPSSPESQLGAKDTFWTDKLPNVLSMMKHKKAHQDVQIRCQRPGCVKGRLVPNLLLDGDDVNAWIRKTQGGWPSLVRGFETCRMVILVGVTVDETISKMLSRVPLTCAQVLIDSKLSGPFTKSLASLDAQTSSRILEGQNYRYVGIINEDTPTLCGVDRGIKELALLAGIELYST
ncbi:ankyrin repeat-containing domain protein [Chytriomyces cf. hyalinus JEL632]|nr:ankyrin repeat-containing domain protein [Chytriomyces cf. hyalinus JEL632]